MLACKTFKVGANGLIGSNPACNNKRWVRASFGDSFLEPVDQAIHRRDLETGGKISI